MASCSTNFNLKVVSALTGATFMVAPVVSSSFWVSRQMEVPAECQRAFF